MCLKVSVIGWSIITCTQKNTIKTYQSLLFQKDTQLALHCFNG
jgi:hypothetical protein